MLGLPFWPLGALVGNVWAYDLLVLLSFVAAGALTCWWLRSIALSRGAALVGGTVFVLLPYRVGQSTGHLLGLVAFLLPAVLLALERRRFVVAALLLCAIPLSGQVHLALGAIPLVLGYAWARLPRGLWWQAGAVALAGVGAGLVARHAAIVGSVASGRSFAQVSRYSAELSDFVTRGVGSGVEELVFVGWLVPLLAIGGAWWLRRRRGLVALLVLATVIPSILALGANLPGYESLWRHFPGLDATRVPERLLPVACLALAALAAAGVELATTWCTRCPGWVVATGLVALVALDLRVPVFGAVAADTPTPAYAAIRGDGRLLELPVFAPDVHYGSVYLGYARQSPRERPQGYSTLARPEADVAARRLRDLSCGKGEVPQELGVRWVAVHRGLYAQSGFFAPGCPQRAELALERRGWRLVRRDGAIALYGRE